MARYIYDLAADRPDELPITMVTNDLISIWCGDISYGTATLDASGTIEMDLPEPVVKRLNHGFLDIVPTFRKIGKPGRPAGNMQELVKIDILPRS